MNSGGNPNRCFNHHKTGSAAAHHYRPGRSDVHNRRWWGETEALFKIGCDYFWSKSWRQERRPQ